MVIIALRINALAMSVSVVIAFSSYTFLPLVIEIRLKKRHIICSEEYCFS